MRPLAQASERSYPEFVHELEDESGLRVDLRDHGTILFSTEDRLPNNARRLTETELYALEPALEVSSPASSPPVKCSAAHLMERSVDPRALMAAAIKAARHRSVDISSGNEAKAVLIAHGRVVGVETDKSSY